MVYSDSHLLSVLRYVEGNPVRAGIVKSATDWCWSSYNEKIADNKYRILIDKPPIELPENWNELIDQTFNEQELKGIQQSINRGSPYGPSEWRRDICKKLGLESTIRARGRPKKELTIGQKK
jgi:putative transposase